QNADRKLRSAKCRQRAFYTLHFAFTYSAAGAVASTPPDDSAAASAASGAAAGSSAGFGFTMIFGSPASGTTFGALHCATAASCSFRCVPSGPYFLISTFTRSEGFAPTPSQYFTRSWLSWQRASVSGIIGS